MKRSQAGFTIIELIIAIVIGSVLTSIALSRVSGAQTRLAVRGAQTTFASVYARARVHGIEMGENVLFRVDAAGDSIWIEHDGNVIEIVRFGEDDVDLKMVPTTTTSLTLCFSPRGYTDIDCNSSNAFHRVHFLQASDSTGLWSLPLGQLLLDP
jgi:prepilin-type N-terminal cleavage/methylation domain-containing protein